MFGVILGQLWFLAPKVRNVTAWGNAPGEMGLLILEALKARNTTPATHFAPSALPGIPETRLGRWPRLLHFAPLALRPNS